MPELPAIETVPPEPPAEQPQEVKTFIFDLKKVKAIEALRMFGKFQRNEASMDELADFLEKVVVNIEDATLEDFSPLMEAFSQRVNKSSNPRTRTG
jgi:hypothetical protein